jgi:UDP-glucose 4-epimerase
MATGVEGKTILVTGGAGLVGSHLVGELVERGAGKVIAYDNLVRGKERHLSAHMEKGEVHLVQADIEDRDALARSMEGVDLCFHQAAMWLRACQEEPRRGIEVNVLGTFNVLEACVNAGVQKIVAASSSSVYGEGLYLPTDEKHPFNNDLFYGMTKIADEQLYTCFKKKYGLDFNALRYLNVYGPHQPFKAAYTDVIMHFMNRVDAGEPPRIEGDGNQTVDLIYAGDAARLNVMARESDVSGEFFNGCTGEETSLTALALAILRVMGREDIQPEYVPRDQNLVTRRAGCPKKAREMLGFVADTPLDEGLAATLAWRREENSLAG